MKSTIKTARSIDSAAFTQALSLAANGVSIVTTDGKYGSAGLTVSSMCSVCADPALVLACVNADNEFCGLADANQCFAINVLTLQQIPLSLIFAGIGDTPEHDRFKHGQWTRLKTGSPILASALIGMDCEIESASTHGSHRIYIGRVIDITNSDGSALVYTQRQYARSVLIPDA